ncbi:hypothetical protein ACROYT_G024482 [Oculina patagonica]
MLNRVTFSPLSQQLWEKNPCIAIPIFNESSPSPAYNFDVPLDHNEGYCLGSQTATGEAWSLKNEYPDEFPSVMTNSAGTIIGVSCGGTMFCVGCAVICYFLYKHCTSNEPEEPTKQRNASSNPPLFEATVSFDLTPVAC